MSISTNPVRSLPNRPSEEFLHKEAKRFAREHNLKLAAAQCQIAHEYGYRNWAKMMTAVEMMAAPDRPSRSGSSSQAFEPPPKREAEAKALPFIPMRGLVAFPNVSYPVWVHRPTSIRATEYAKEHGLPIVIAAQKNVNVLSPSSSDIYDVGISVGLVDSVRLPDGGLKCAIEGKHRLRIGRVIFEQDFLRAEARAIDESRPTDDQIEKLVKSVLSAFVRRRLVTATEALSNPEMLAVLGTSADGASVLADRIASELPMEIAEKQALLETLDPVQRLEKILTRLSS